MFYTHADCRACGHWHYWHPDTLVKSICNRSYHNECQCNGEDFAPADNLEYLEWKYKRKLNGTV